MQALIVESQTDTGVRLVTDRLPPTPAPDEVLVQVNLAGICATDLEIARGYMGFAGVPGHEFVGTVIEGSDQLRGRRVVADINCACGTCDFCQRHLPNHCPHRTVLGIAGRDGAFAEYLVIPARNCHVVPDEITDQQAVFVEPVAAAAHVLDDIDFAANPRIALIGTGRLGLLTAQVLATQATHLDVIGRNRRTLKLAREWGLTTMHVDTIRNEPAYDVVVECTGNPAGLAWALRATRPRGTIIVKSTYAEPAALDLAPIVIHEFRLIGSRCGTFPRALELLRNNQVNVDPLVTATFPLSDAQAAFATAAQPDQLKVLIQPEHA
jgi:2-desacetyl-2-hydroxyethyl bacteriochlorophyllide A dehydrogenase